MAYGLDLEGMKAVIFAKESTRLQGKHLLSLCGKPMIQRIGDILTASNRFDEVVVYSKYPSLQIRRLKVKKDDSTGSILDSIIAAIKEFNEFLAVAGDMPLIDDEIISRILDNYDGVPVAPVTKGGRIEPLFSVYNDSILGRMERYSKENRRIFPFLIVNFQMIKLDQEESKKMFNVNTEEDYLNVKRLLSCE